MLAHAVRQCVAFLLLLVVENVDDCHFERWRAVVVWALQIQWYGVHFNTSHEFVT